MPSAACTCSFYKIIFCNILKLLLKPLLHRTGSSSGFCICSGFCSSKFLIRFLLQCLVKHCSLPAQVLLQHLLKLLLKFLIRFLLQCLIKHCSLPAQALLQNLLKPLL
jgi:hypothetical protein